MQRNRDMQKSKALFVIGKSKVFFKLYSYLKYCYNIKKDVSQSEVEKFIGLWFMVFNATFNHISVISWWSVFLVEETGVPGEHHRPAASHWQTLSRTVALVVINPTTIRSWPQRPRNIYMIHYYYNIWYESITFNFFFMLNGNVIWSRKQSTGKKENIHCSFVKEYHEKIT